MPRSQMRQFNCTSEFALKSLHGTGESVCSKFHSDRLFQKLLRKTEKKPKQ